MSDNVFWMSLWALVLAAVVTMASLLQYNYCRHIQRMAELGYQEEPVVGMPAPVWRKVADSANPVNLELPSVTRPAPNVTPQAWAMPL